MDRNQIKVNEYSSYKAYKLGEQIHADLMFLKDKTIVLIMVDTFSRYLRMVVLPNKQAAPIKKHIDKFKKDLNSKDAMIITDGGKEFSGLKNQHISKSFYGTNLIESHIGRVKKVLLKLSLLAPLYPYKDLIPIAEEILNERYMTITKCIPKEVFKGNCKPKNHKCIKDEFVHPIHSYCLIPNQDKKGAKLEKKSVFTNWDTRIYVITKKTYHNCRYRYQVAPLKIVIEDGIELEGSNLLNKFYYEELYIIEPSELKDWIKGLEEHHRDIDAYESESDDDSSYEE